MTPPLVDAPTLTWAIELPLASADDSSNNMLCESNFSLVNDFGTRQLSEGTGIVVANHEKLPCMVM